MENQPPFKAIKLPREYKWNINSMLFSFIVPVWLDDQATPREILIHDLEYIVGVLASFKEDNYILPDGTAIPMQTYKLPPINPEETNGNGTAGA